jgi:hypothetical protein
MLDLKKLRIQAIPRIPAALKAGANYRVPNIKSDTKKSSTPDVVKYSIQEVSPDKLQKGEIDLLKIDPNVYETFSRNSGGQLLIDLNQDNQRKRYTINLQVSKFEDAKFNEIIDIEFEEFLPTRSINDEIADLTREIERLKIENARLEDRIKLDKRLETELRTSINESNKQIKKLEGTISTLNSKK